MSEKSRVERVTGLPRAFWFWWSMTLWGLLIVIRLATTMDLARAAVSLLLMAGVVYLWQRRQVNKP